MHAVRECPALGCLKGGLDGQACLTDTTGSGQGHQPTGGVSEKSTDFDQFL